jgi:hypothetical protein
MTQSKLQPTDYSTLQQHILRELEAARPDYQSCVTALLAAMRHYFPSLIETENPVIRHFGQWSAANLRFIIQEYSGFSNAAIHMFLEARIRNHWPALTKEIIRNMDEEFGVLTRNIAHLELMRHGYRAELNIETEEIQRTALTRDFIDRMTALFCSPDNAFLAGCLLAFEGTAVDEFRIVERMLREYESLRGREIPADSLTGNYIAGHVTPETPDRDADPEMDHYRGMVDAIGLYITAENMPRLVRGFFAVCLELNQWWEQLATTTFLNPLRAQLRSDDLAPTNLHQLFAQRAPDRLLT